MPPIRLGVIGTGLIWIRTHKSILETMTDAFVPVAFCDLSEERRATIAQEYPDAYVLSDYQSLLELAEVEAVLVLTPIALNAPVARAALQAGKHVIMEKPIARSVAEGRELISSMRQSSCLLYVTEQMAYRHAEDLLAEIIAAGEIGELVMWDRVQHLEADTASESLRYESTPWRKQADFPLGTMFDGGIHLIAGLSKVFGIPESLDATGRQLRPQYGDYDHIATLFQYGQGVTGMLSYSSYLPPGRNHFHIYGTSGVISVDQERLIVEQRGQPARVVELPKENAYVNMWHALHQAFVEQRDPFYTAEKALHDVAVLEAINQAIKMGSRVTVNAGISIFEPS
jgi:scyllo-inositol 2-dehydrogenase (NADP+)